MSKSRLDTLEIDAWLEGHPQWSLRDGKLTRELTFKHFNEAWGFMTQIALIAETMNHHPDWSNVYNRVSIALTTHDAHGLTALDTTLAEKIDTLLLGEPKGC